MTRCANERALYGKPGTTGKGVGGCHAPRDGELVETSAGTESAIPFAMAIGELMSKLQENEEEDEKNK